MGRGVRLALADGDPAVLAIVAYVLGSSGEDVNTGLALVDRSVSLNPSYARSFGQQPGQLVRHAQHPIVAGVEVEPLGHEPR